MPAMTAVPAHADPHAAFPTGDITAYRIDEPDDLVPGHARIVYAGKSTGHREHIAVTDAARLHLDAHLAWPRCRNVTLDDFEGGIGLGNLDYFHSRHQISPSNRLKFFQPLDIPTLVSLHGTHNPTEVMYVFKI